MLYHGVIADRLTSWESFTSGGFLGVSAFFTLSGFLIVSLMLREAGGTGTLSLRSFWSRRFRRLLPASLMLLCAVVVLTPRVGSPSQLQGLTGDVWASLADVVNWRFILNGSDYAQQFVGAPSPVTHMWSLSVEEQWYLLLPLVVLAVVWAARRSGRSLRWLVGVAFSWIALGSLACMLWFGHGSYSNRVYLGTDTRMSEMAVGALAAVALSSGTVLGGRARRLVVVAGSIALPVLLVMWAVVRLESDWLYRGGFTLHAALVALVIVAVVQPRHPLRSATALAPLVALGRISYGVYLFHWPIVWWLTPDRLHLPAPAALVVQIAASVAVAVVSYRLVEQPVRHGRMVLGWRRPALPIAAIAVVALGAAMLPAPPRDQVLALGNDRGRLAAPTPSRAEGPETVARDGTAAVPTAAPTTVPPPLRIMVVGDSFAESIATGMLRWGPASGQAAVLDQATPGCALVGVGVVRVAGFTSDTTDKCAGRDREIAAALQSFRPDVVFVAGGMIDVSDRRPPGFARTVAIGQARYDDYLAAGLSRLADLVGSTGAHVIWSLSPHWDPVPGVIMMTGDPPYHEADPARADRFNAILTLVMAQHPNVTVFDLPSWMRAQPGGELARSLRLDGAHFTEESTDRVAAWLGPQLLALGGRRPTPG